MKFLIVLLMLGLSTHAFAENVSCRSDYAIQENEPNGMHVDAILNFTLNRETKDITNLIGHIFVQQSFIENEDIGVYNSYMGFFDFDKISYNPNYKPIRYKGYTQFKKFDAIHTAGLESGMWGEFVMDITTPDVPFDARYIFQAGDHMGGVVIFTCRVN